MTVFLKYVSTFSEQSTTETLAPQSHRVRAILPPQGQGMSMATVQWGSACPSLVHHAGVCPLWLCPLCPIVPLAPLWHRDLRPTLACILVSVIIHTPDLSGFSQIPPTPFFLTRASPGMQRGPHSFPWGQCH